MKDILPVTILCLLLNSGCAPALVAGVGTGSTIVASDHRTFGSLIDDANIELKINKMITDHRKLSEAANISVTSVNGVVLLTGQVPDAELRDQVLATARDVKGVRRTINEIAIAPVNKLSDRSRNVWITSKVKTRLISDERIDSTRIKVITENRSVFLMGLVAYQEGEYATQAASNVSGIERVVKLFEYID